VDQLFAIAAESQLSQMLDAQIQQAIADWTSKWRERKNELH